MSASKAPFPFFMAVPVRDLTHQERETVLRLLEAAEPLYTDQVASLRVVGRCGCGECPTVFFEKAEPGVHEQDISTYAGKDTEGGVVVAVLLQKHGRLSQLEYYSADGHDPWYPPRAQGKVCRTPG